jgi:hypothetical protein
LEKNAMALLTFRRSRLCQLGAGTLIAVFAAGCSRGNAESNVSGRVLLDGKPLPGGTVVFVPAASGVNNVAAQIDESGNFGPILLPVGEVMVSVDNRSLAPPPQIHASVTIPKGASPELRAKMAARNASPAPSVPPNPRYRPIPVRYQMIETAEDLKFTVVPGEQKHDIEMSSK